MAVSYFDNAATTFPKPEEVYVAMDTFYRTEGVSIGRGQYSLAAKAANMSDETRRLILSLLNCSNKQVLFSHTATEALNLVLNNTIQDGDTIYITPFEHNAVTRVINYMCSSKNLTVKQLPFVLKEWRYDIQAISDDFSETPPDLVVLTHASNVCGVLSPIDEICKKAKQYDATTIVDMSQTAGLVPTDLSSTVFDYAIFDGHKTLYAPFGIAGIIGSSFKSFMPLIIGGTGIESANQNMPDVFPEKYEAGTHNSLAISGLNASLKWISKLGVSNLFAEENSKRVLLIELLEKHSNIRLYAPPKEQKAIGVVSCTFDNYSSDSIGQVLSDFEIAVRTGLHCAPLAHQLLGTFPSGTVRFSLSHFTSEDDLEKLDRALSYIEENS